MVLLIGVMAFAALGVFFLEGGGVLSFVVLLLIVMIPVAGIMVAASVYPDWFRKFRRWPWK